MYRVLLAMVLAALGATAAGAQTGSSPFDTYIFQVNNSNSGCGNNAAQCSLVFSSTQHAQVLLKSVSCSFQVRLNGPLDEFSLQSVVLSALPSTTGRSAVFPPIALVPTFLGPDRPGLGGDIINYTLNNQILGLFLGTEQPVVTISLHGGTVSQSSCTLAGDYQG